MVSIITCSKDRLAADKLFQNVSRTIGVPFEFICIENDGNKHSICQAYNIGVQKAAHNIFAFVHEDVQFVTDNWGEKLVNLFQQSPHLGLLGIAGAIYKSEFPCPWTIVPQEAYRTNIGQQKEGIVQFHRQVNPSVEKFSEVAVLDGCILFSTRQVFKTFSWNEEQLHGFHLYDMDASIRIRKKYTVAVANEISAIHFSEGSFDKNWFKTSVAFHLKNRHLLPVCVGNSLKNREYDFMALRFLLFKSKELGMKKEMRNFLFTALYKFPNKKDSWKAIYTYVFQ